MSEQAPSGMNSTSGSDGSLADREGSEGFPSGTAQTVSGASAPSGSQGGDAGAYGAER